MINLCFLLKRLSSIVRKRCFTYPVLAMAPTEWEFKSDDNPWNASTFVSAIVELFLSILLLLGAAIAFITSRFVKVFGLEPPCTYIGCSHPLQFESFRGRVYTASTSCKSKNLCTGEFCPDRHPSRFYLKLHSNDGSNHEEGSSSDSSQERNAFSSRDHNATQNDNVDVSSGHGHGHEMHLSSCDHPCSCSNSQLYRRRNQGNFPKRTICARAESNRDLNEDDLPLLSGSSGGFDAEDQCEISEVSADSEEERAWKETCTKDDEVLHDDASFAHNNQALLEDVNEKIYGVRVCSAEPSPDELWLTANYVGTCLKSNDAGRTIDDAVDAGRTIDDADDGYANNGKVDDGGFANIPTIQRVEDERTMYNDDDCSGNGLSLASLDLGSQEASGERITEACLKGADAPCEMDGRHLEGEVELCGIILTSCNRVQEELFMKDPSRGIEGDVFDHAVPTEESPDAPTTSSVQSFSLAQCGRSSTHVEGMAVLVSPAETDEDDGETISEEEKEEAGLDALKMALQAERSSLAALEEELENERNAAAVATNEAMAMISRLQEEKSAMQMEVAQLQRTSEEKADYDEQAMALLKEILFKRETENMALEKEVELYRERLLEEKGDGLLKGNWFKEEAGSASPHSVKRLLLASEDEDLSSPMNQQHALVSSAQFYHSGTRSALCVPRRMPNMDTEELNAFSLDQNVNKRSRDSPRSDKVVGMSSSTVWDDEGRHRDYWDGGFHGQHSSFEQLRKMGRSVFSTDDEDAQSVLERLWVLEEELQELRGKDDSGGQKLWSKAHEVQQLAADSPTHKWADGSLADVWGGQPACGIKSKGEGEVLELDGVAGGFVPIHDVYEVHSSSNRSPPCTEEGDSVEGLQGTLRNSELCAPENFVPARIARHKTQVPPKISQTRKIPFSDEIPHTPPFTPQAAGWIVGKSSYPGSPCEHYDLPSQSLVSREGKRMEWEEIQQLAVRLKALEEDRELLRETLESFKHRDAELSLLQEIAQHLRELRMAGLTGVSGGVLQEEVSVMSPSKSRALKKRRYYSGPGQPQMHLLQQTSI